MTTKTTSNSALKYKSEINSTGENDGRAGDARLTTDEVFHLLQNERRRRVLQYLREHDEGEGVDMRDVVEWIAAEEHDTTVQALRSKERQRVYIALYQSHLPKLDEAGVIDYDQRRGWVCRTARTEEVERHIPDIGTTEDDESAGGLPTGPAATGVGALLLIAGYSGYVPIVSDAIVSVGLFVVLCTLAFAQYLE